MGLRPVPSDHGDEDPMPKTDLFPAAADAYLAARTDRLRSRSSQQAVRSVLRGLQRAHPGLQLQEFTEADLVAFLQNPAWKPNTVLRNRSVLIQVFRWAKRAGLVPEDPAAFLADEVRPRARASGPPSGWRTTGSRTSWLAARTPPKRTRDLLVLALPIYTGPRLSEFAAPPPGQPDRGLAWGGVRPSKIKVFGKGERWDTVGVSPCLAAVLTDWRSRYEEGLVGPSDSTTPCWFGRGSSGRTSDLASARGSSAGAEG